MNTVCAYDQKSPQCNMRITGRTCPAMFTPNGVCPNSKYNNDTMTSFAINRLNFVRQPSLQS